VCHTTVMVRAFWTFLVVNLFGMMLCLAPARADDLEEAAPLQTPSKRNSEDAVLAAGHLPTAVAPVLLAGLVGTGIVLCTAPWSAMIFALTVESWQSDPAIRNNPLFLFAVAAAVIYMSAVFATWMMFVIGPLAVGPVLVWEGVGWVVAQGLLRRSGRAAGTALVAQLAMMPAWLAWTAVATAMFAPVWAMLAFFAAASVRPDLLPRGIGLDILLMPLMLFLGIAVAASISSLVVLPALFGAGLVARVVAFHALEARSNAAEFTTSITE